MKDIEESSSNNLPGSDPDPDPDPDPNSDPCPNQGPDSRPSPDSSPDHEPSPGTEPGPWPWYVLLSLGYCFSGLFPWLLVLWAAFRRGERRIAYIGLGLNLAFYGVFAAYMMESSLAWWWLSASIYGINLLWAAGGWLFQRRFIGAPLPRYIWAERSLWVSPIVVGLVIGISLSIIAGIPGALKERQAMQVAADILNRESVLWNIMQNGLKGIPFGLLLGLWWAGKAKRFSASRVITFLSAYCASIAFAGVAGLLMVFILCGGSMNAALLAGSPDWALHTPWATGLPKALTRLGKLDFSHLLAMSLLFGAAPRIRDFFKRLLWLPAILLVTLPFVFVANEWWAVLQGRIITDMAAPKESARAAAFDRGEQLLHRYPEHLQWPRIAEAAARYRYQTGRYDSARALYEAIVKRFQGSNQWYWEVRRAEAALGSPHFGHPRDTVKLQIPMVDYESYLTHNWMALLTVIRYWEGPQVPESKIKIRLKALSGSEDKIQLNPLVSIADLDDAAESLDYQATIIPADPGVMEALLSNGVPAILVDKGVFQVIHGYDPSRSMVMAYSFESLSDFTRNADRKEAKEILSLKAEGDGESQERLDRISHEAETEYSLGFWESDALRYRAPFMVIVHPRAKAGQMADILRKSVEAVAKESKGYLAAFIGLAYLSQADPVQGVEWAGIGSRLISSPLPLYVGRLSHLHWQSREKKVKTRLQFQDQFHQLEAVERFFDDSERLAFLAEAEDRWSADFREGALPLPYFVLDALEKTLIPDDPEDRQLLLEVAGKRVDLDPSDSRSWEALARVCERTADLPALIAALEGQTASAPLNSEAKLGLAYALVLSGEYAKAESTLSATDPEKIRFDADYPFCRGAIAEAKGNLGKALQYYKTAIDMRRYKPVYHLRYGRLLLAEGRKDEARKALQWAARIDASGDIRKRAEELLSEMKS